MRQPLETVEATEIGLLLSLIKQEENSSKEWFKDRKRNREAN